MPYEEQMRARHGHLAAARLHELLDTCFTEYRSHHPWVAEAPSPKSIVREMLEAGDGFATFVRRYRLDRSEGLVLRYLTDAWRTLDRSLPDDVYVDELEDVVDWLGALIRATDTTLLDEWTRLAGGPVHEHHAVDTPAVVAGPPAAWRTAVRTAAFGWVELLARRQYGVLAERTGWDVDRLIEAMGPYWDEYDALLVDADTRRATHVQFVDEPGRWVVTQFLADPDGDGEWRFTAVVDLERAMADGAPTLELSSLGSAAR